MDSPKEKKAFSLVARMKSVTHAWRGVCVFFKTTHNVWVQSSCFLFEIILAIILRISGIEWILVILSGGLLIVAEAFNTAIEIDIDLTSPNYHPYARDTKDIAAGAVLLMSIITAIVGLIIFLPKIF
ncbi:MAG: diacylglycerol kinase family protein [Candidatus Pacebacteria bacterium]|nr:diacylglycerol kinase family protein [Candidatus Paceibacterota bacterium]